MIVNDIRKKEEQEIQTKTRVDDLYSRVVPFRQQITDYGYEFLVGKQRLSEIDLKKKSASIFQGLASLNSKPDTILIEEKLIP